MLVAFLVSVLPIGSNYSSPICGCACHLIDGQAFVISICSKSHLAKEGIMLNDKSVGHVECFLQKVRCLCFFRIDRVHIKAFLVLLFCFASIVGCATTEPMEGTVPKALVEGLGMSQDLDEFNANFPKLRKGMTADEVDRLIPLGYHRELVSGLRKGVWGVVYSITLPRAILTFSTEGLEEWHRTTNY